MTIFGRQTIRESEEIGLKAEKIKQSNARRLDKLEVSSTRLHRLLLADGITLRVYIATGGDRRHA